MLHLSPPWTTPGSVESIRTRDRDLILTCGESSLRIQILAPNLIRVRFVPRGEFAARRPWAVTIPDEHWSSVAFDTEEREDKILLSTPQMRLEIDRASCRLAFFDSNNTPFACDDELGMRWRLGSVAVSKQIAPGECFYGFGEPTGLLNRFGRVHTQWTTDAFQYESHTDPMYQAIPFFLSLREGVGYGLFLNSTFWSRFDMGATQRSLLNVETRAPELDYYVIYGPEPAKIIQTYTQLTGRISLPPKWALGYQQCRWSYDSEAAVRELMGEFRDRALPCDTIYLDIDYMRGYRVFTWSPKRFANPQKLIADLQQGGFKTVTIVDPGVKHEPEADYAVFDEGVEGDYFVRKANGELFHGYVWPDKAVFPDFMRPEVRDWWGNWHQRLTELGVAGIWNDMNEPSLKDRPFSDNGEHIPFPDDAPQGPAEARSTHAEVHNLYGLMMAKTAAEAMLQLRAGKRSFILTRSGYAGIQKYSAVWTGDNRSSWEQLEMSLPMLCNLGLSGVPFVGVDIGGFFGDATPELFARWMQAGVVYPLMRGHSALGTAQHEPWAFGDRVEGICRESMELRYRLLPYLYTLFQEAETVGSPILRPLMYHFSTDRQTYQVHDQVFLGPFLMAAPVYRPGVRCRAVYLPQGVWYDWRTGEKLEGGRYVLADAPLERMPMFARSGAIIPLQPVMQYVGEKSVDVLTLRVYPGTGEWTLYEDDGESFEYQQGAFCTTSYKVGLEGGRTIVEIEARRGNWHPPKREVIVDVVGVGQQRFEDRGEAQRLEF
ncbi:MAG: glycoside hydrolase family 31 protein [Cyanobacteriota bacterium]|nr:glycoside hydrolase family 31 protein [Cyanobacteriota bacterium]